MHRSEASRRWLLALASALVFTMPLSLAGCSEGGGGEEGDVTVPKNFEEAHKDTLNQFQEAQKNQEQKK